VKRKYVTYARQILPDCLIADGHHSGSIDLLRTFLTSPCGGQRTAWIKLKGTQWDHLPGWKSKPGFGKLYYLDVWPTFPGPMHGMNDEATELLLRPTTEPITPLPNPGPHTLRVKGTAWVAFDEGRLLECFELKVPSDVKAREVRQEVADLYADMFMVLEDGDETLWCFPPQFNYAEMVGQDDMTQDEVDDLERNVVSASVFLKLKFG
jgi:hypothetical protein